MLDLHGLHKKEAIEVLAQKLESTKKANASRSAERIQYVTSPSLLFFSCILSFFFSPLFLIN